MRSRDPGRGSARPLLMLAAVALALAACSGGAGGVVASNTPEDVGGPGDDVGGQSSDEFIPTFPPDDLASGTAACIDEPTMEIIDQLRAPGASVDTLLADNKDALIAGLADLESADPKTTDWRDALLTALTDDDTAGAAAQIDVLVEGDLTITLC